MMRLLWVLVFISIIGWPPGAFAPPQRPAISGIALVQFRVSDPQVSRSFYAGTLALPQGTSGCFSPPEPERNACFYISASQQLEIVHADTSSKNLETLGFQVRDADAMCQYLRAHGVNCLGTERSNAGDKFVVVLDPERHRILFIDSANKAGDLRLSPTNIHMIHAGFVVHDRAAADHFYKDILGFRLYWHGGMKDNQTNWVAMQVPDGTDWLEYMLNVSPNADHHTLGGMNHFSLGVEDLHVAEKQLIANGWKPTEEPKIGRDGKWQLNLYDPDETRIEFMEFTPKEKPCGSECSGPHPGPRNC
jgi:catechol 2,3-dioxygenase-like lactoylglutathione lyase family enzyme